MFFSFVRCLKMILKASYFLLSIWLFFKVILVFIFDFVQQLSCKMSRFNAILQLKCRPLDFQGGHLAQVGLQTNIKSVHGLLVLINSISCNRPCFILHGKVCVITIFWVLIVHNSCHSQFHLAIKPEEHDTQCAKLLIRLIALGRPMAGRLYLSRVW